MGNQYDEKEFLTTSRQRSPRSQFNYFSYGSTTVATTPPPSTNHDEQDSLVGEELIPTDNECEIRTNSEDDETYQHDFRTDDDNHQNRTGISTGSVSVTFASFNSILAFLLVASVVSFVTIFLVPTVKPQTQSFEIPFPQIDRATFNDPVEGFINMELFAPRLILSDGDAERHSESDTSGSFSLPFPTGAFWTNLVVKLPMESDMSYPIVVYPFAYRWSSSSLQVSYPASNRVVDTKEVQDQFLPELTLTTKEDVKFRHIINYDQLSVTLRYAASSSPNSNWQTALVQGNPYVTLTYTNMTPMFKPLSTFSDVICPGDENEDIVDLIEGDENEDSRKLFGVCSIDVRINCVSGMKSFIVPAHKIRQLLRRKNGYCLFHCYLLTLAFLSFCV